jgi:hypothetical protein
MKAGGDLEFVAQRRACLREVAQAALRASLGPAEIASALRAATRVLQDGSLELEYDFADARQAEDFVSAKPALKDAWLGRMPIPARAKHASEMRVEDGELVVLGANCWAHKVGFRAPLRISYEFAFENVQLDDAVLPWFELVLAAGDKLAGIECAPDGGMAVTDPREQYARVSNVKNPGLTLGPTYKVEIVHDGQRVTTWLDGEQRVDAACGPRRSGALLLVANGDTPTRFARLRIEGRPDTSADSEFARAWTAQRLAELGLE